MPLTNTSLGFRMGRRFTFRKRPTIRRPIRGRSALRRTFPQRRPVRPSIAMIRRDSSKRQGIRPVLRKPLLLPNSQAQRQRIMAFGQRPIIRSKAKRHQSPNVSPTETSEQFYRNKLVVHHENTDMFDKVLRAHVIGNYILKYNNYYDFLLQADPKDICSFPKQISKLFVISFRPERHLHFQRRMGPWAKQVELWPGVDGSKLDKNQLLKDGILSHYEFRKGESTLRRGEIGCYLAHYGLWQHIVEHKISSALIMEDDADICYSTHIVKRLEKMFNDVERLHLDPDLIYLGHNDYFPPTTQPNTEIATPADCQGLFTYWVTLSGCQKLLQMCMPIGPPVDVKIFAMRKNIRQYSLEPRLNWVRSVWSDTNNVW